MCRRKARFFIPSSIWSTIFCGSSVLGLSDVIIVKSAILPDISPIIGLLEVSLSPPQPNRHGRLL